MNSRSTASAGSPTFRLFGSDRRGTKPVHDRRTEPPPRPRRTGVPGPGCAGVSIRPRQRVSDLFLDRGDVARQLVTLVFVVLDLNHGDDVGRAFAHLLVAPADERHHRIPLALDARAGG